MRIEDKFQNYKGNIIQVLPHEKGFIAFYFIRKKDGGIVKAYETGSSIQVAKNKLINLLWK